MTLREFRGSDAERIALLLNNRRISKNLKDCVPFPYTVTDADKFIGFCQSEAPQMTFVIELEDELVGVIALIPQKDIYRLSAEIGFWLGEPYWDKGIVTEAIKRMIHYAFDELGLVRLYAGVFGDNPGSGECLQKAGFKFEGILEKAVIKDGEMKDEFRYALINPDWEEATK
ncbi:N-acetyltransferase [Fulvitalea axinellae]|uniref:N-acetyltransferase n=1 Tax=Fulvitalea axinellae TaxID=1182444 RepID=A0AAU9CS83_9BACT|nr:N-acetyltransferase [Fulvitalea axinellae]